MRRSVGSAAWNAFVAFVAVAALALGIAGVILGNNAKQSQPMGLGNIFTEASPNVNLTQAPGVTSLGVIFGFSLFQSGFGFGSVSGQIVTNTSGPQTIVIYEPLSIIAGYPIMVGAIPGLFILAIDNTTTYPVQFNIAPTQYDVTLEIPDIQPGQWFFTQPFFGAIS